MALPSTSGLRRTSRHYYYHAVRLVGVVFCVVGTILAAFATRAQDTIISPLLTTSTTTATTKNITSALSDVFTLPTMNRTLLLVHIGKAGGLTVRETLKLWNKERQKLFNDNYRLQPKPFHMWAHYSPHMEAATTLVVVLRNPIDRIISTYRYSHPQQCTPKWQRLGKRGHRVPYGCHITAKRSSPKTKLGLWAAKVYDECFPSAAIENFAQSALSPWSSEALNSSFTLQQQRECQKMARNMVEGSLVKQLAAPHMEYNYEYYAQRSIWAFPANSTKEIIGIRLEHTQQDMQACKEALWQSNFNGGTEMPLEDDDQHEEGGDSLSQTHGSETYLPSPITTEAYHKLCCVLQKEIAIYQEFLQRSINLSQQQRDDSMRTIWEKCGIKIDWEDWRLQCQLHLDEDYKELQEAIMEKKNRM